MVYVLAAGRGQVIPQREEVTGCAWIPLAKVADLDTPPELPALIEKAAEYACAVRGSQATLSGLRSQQAHCSGGHRTRAGSFTQAVLGD